jgi:hypothetical protein
MIYTTEEHATPDFRLSDSPELGGDRSASAGWTEKYHRQRVIP